MINITLVICNINSQNIFFFKELFFDPKKNTGYIATRLSNARRSKTGPRQKATIEKPIQSDPKSFIPEEIDGYFILLPTKDITKATDFLFKSYYVFNIEFCEDLKTFWTFLQNYCYNIPSKCTNRVMEIYTKVETTKNEIDSQSLMESDE